MPKKNEIKRARKGIKRGSLTICLHLHGHYFVAQIVENSDSLLNGSDDSAHKVHTRTRTSTKLHPKKKKTDKSACLDFS